MKKRYRKTKKVSLLFIAIIITLALVYSDVMAEDKVSKCTYENGIKFYNLSYDYDIDTKTNAAKATIKAANNGLKIVAIEEGVYNDSIADPQKAFTKRNSFHLTNLNEVLGKKIYVETDNNSKYNPILKINPLENINETAEVYIRLTLEIADKNPGILCSTKAEYDEAVKNKKSAETVTLYYFVPVPKKGRMSSVLNTMYNTPSCQFLRNQRKDVPKVGNLSIGQDILNMYNANNWNDYKTLMPFCFSEGKVVTTYSDEQVIGMLKSTLQTVKFMHLDFSQSASSAGQNESSFDYMKSQAYASGSGHVYENDSYKGQVISLRCKYNSTSPSRITKDEKAIYNYENKNYYYANKTDDYYANYTYDYDGIKKSESVKVCSKTCEEAVEVSYGPPQAVIAGFCFEYQVKVVSRVQCKSSISASPPQQQGYCTPEPVCDHNHGKFVSTQAGPNEKFDACINKCDGGKYTQKCSKKCYAEVYDSKSTNSQLYSTVKPIANVGANGEYVRNQDGSIVWRSYDGNHTPMRWYQEYDTKTWDSYFVDKNGFKRKDYGSYDCNGVCHNSGCSGEVYLNPSSASHDYQSNLNEYNSTIQECVGGATCTSKNSTYAINVIYKKNGKDEPINFPDQTLSGGKSNPNKNGENSILLDYDGCYNASAQDYYKSEWSFPGTWVNNKTGEISFAEKTTGWHKAQNKFCLPLDAGNENQQWWNWYMAQKKGSTSSGTGSFTSEKYNKECKVNTALPSESSIHWNITAQVKENHDEGFGYFNWRFLIKCFYASNNSSANAGDKNDKCITDFNNYEVRSVTNQDLFPSDEANGAGTVITQGNSSNTGRDPGFNWTEAAAIPANKNKNYAVNPSILIGKIQRIGNEVYTKSGDDEQEYLDYEFNLSPSELNKIRNYNKLHDYNDFGGSVRNVNDVNVYESNLFRSGSLLPAKAIKKLGKIGCNNQANSSNCLSLLN